MKKLLHWFNDNILFLFTLFLLVFIPLYPKLPLVDIKNTWVYIRAEDFIVFFVLFLSGVLLIRNKVTLKTPLTVPILIFWLIGSVASIHSILLIFPDLSDVFPNVAFLSFMRRIEYMSLFFVSYWSMKDKGLFRFVIIFLILTLFAVTFYGIGQKYLGFPAFLTMNEEFAKGFAIQLSPLSRVSSTFGGHYDLAAYFVLVIPIVFSLIFAYKYWFIKVILGTAILLGSWVLFMTVSRISFFALFVSLGLVFFFQRKKIVIFLIPIIGIAAFILLGFLPTLADRFGSTIKETNVLIEAKTGYIIGHVQEVPNTYFAQKIIKQQFSKEIGNLGDASPSAVLIVPYTYLPEKVILLVDPKLPTGEDLPQGTGYINLSLSPVVKRTGNFYYEPKSDPNTGTTSVYTINGDYLLKKALTYDLSFTTRFQGEWPRAIAAFKRNILVGSGYGSVSLAVDNSYLRMLAEVGGLGFASFLIIFIIFGIYIKKSLSLVDSLVIKSFVYGTIGGIVGLAINAIFIDVFEASKIAFLLWILIGLSLGVVRLHQNISLDIYKELWKITTSTYAVIVYLFIAVILLFLPLTDNFITGDDFTWFRWAADCGNNLASVAQKCQPTVIKILQYFVQADGFFYRPGTKIYFLLMYKFFWLNQAAYHMVSIFLHFSSSVLVYMLAKKVLKNSFLAALCGFIFLILTGFSEAIFWISASGFIFAANFSLLSLLSFILWLEKRKKIYFVITISSFVFSLFFHESGVITPLLFVLYKWFSTDEKISIKNILKSVHYRILFSPIIIYLLVRFIAKSHWLSGDYNYNLFKFPLNAIGNSLGYLLLTVSGPISLRFYEILRSLMREHMIISFVITGMVVAAGFVAYKNLIKHLKKDELKIILFGTFFSLIALLPFLGLGNITSRYSYLQSIGIIIIFVYFIKKLYVVLLKSGRDIAIAVTSLIVGIFCLFQIVQLQQIHSDWYEAGEKIRRFYASIESVYDDNWSKSAMEFHFVNVPLRKGDAWVFPVGLPDALWFVFGNSNLKVFIWPSLDKAFSVVQSDSLTQKVFVFNNDGTVTEMKKPTPIVK